MKVIEPLVQDTGGSIDPAAFRAAVAKATDGMAYGRGGDLADLARVAQAFGPREAGGATASRDALGMAAKIAALTGGAATTAAGLKSGACRKPGRPFVYGSLATPAQRAAPLSEPAHDPVRYRRQAQAAG